jgi:glucose-6-phosphate 1-dehydrogenase
VSAVPAYDRVLGDALVGDPSHFSREDYVEEAWRIVDPILRSATPVHGYERNTWAQRSSMSSFRPSPEGGTTQVR